MADLNVSFYSQSLIRPVSFNMYIPNDVHSQEENPHYNRKCKTVFVLHGHSGWGKGWDQIYHLAERYNLALVFPSGENSFYLDSQATAGKYGTFVGSELVDYIRNTFGLCMSKEDTFISGLSMGGFGALHTGLSYPDTFGKIIALSSALIIHQIAGMQPNQENPIANYYYYRNCFGDLDQLLESDNNPEVLVKKLQQQGRTIPDIYMACGTEDFLLEVNRQFYQFLVVQNVKVEYIESEGDHNMEFWNDYFAKGFAWILD